MRNRGIGLALVFLGAALLTGALLLFLHNERQDTQAGEAAQSALSEVQEAIGKEAPAATLPSTGETEPTEAVTVPPELTVVNIDGNDYVGYLAIPDFALELPVMADWSMEKLRIAPCLQYGSPLTDDAVIAGHNYKKHFRALHDIQVGQSVTFTDMTGQTIGYTVAEVKILDPKSVDEVVDSGYDLVLYTCTLGGKSRVTVFCNRTE
ncbi:MAG: sortase [Firmicutes bacterium]|nr:sortase [Bacillota bacterium]